MRSYLKEQVDKIMAYLFKVERRTLLWENPNPDTAFTAQNINVDLSDYDEIEVVAKHWSNNGTIASARCKTTELGCILVPNGASAHMAFRDWQGHTGYIYMAQGRDLYGTSLSYSDYAGIPLRIYGIKSGGVLRNPVIAVLSAISRIGGGVNEGDSQGTAFENTGKATTENRELFCDSFICGRAGFGNDKHAVANRCGYKKSVHIVISERTMGLLRNPQRFRCFDSNCVQEQLFFSIFCTYRTNSILRNLTISERRWAA